MIAYLKELKFKSTTHTYIKDITLEVEKAIKKSKTKDGFAFVNSKHTTLGMIVHEIAEPNLIEDIINHSLASVAEDKRSSRVSKDYSHSTTDYKHRCQDNPFCDEIDEDYNAGAHIRAITFSHNNVVVPIRKGKLDFGKYQQIAIFEFDGRDGKGKNPVRQRTVQIWICPADEIIEI